MRVGHPLRLSRCAGGIAQRGRIVLLQIRIDRSTEVVTQQGFVVLQSCGHGLAAERNHEDTLKLHFVLELFKELQEHVVYNQEAVLGVVDDVRQFVGMEPKVQGVQHATCAGDAEVGFQVGIVVPHKACDPVSRLKTRRLENCGKGSCTLGHFPVGVTVNRVVGAAGDNLDVRKKFCRPLEERP